MKEELKSEGKYELFTTPDGKEVVNFDNEAFYSFSEENGGDYISSTDPDPDKFSSKATGKYFYVGAKSDEDPKGTLYLEDGPEFRKLEFPEGWPTKRNEPKKKIIRSGDRLKKEEILKKMES